MVRAVPPKAASMLADSVDEYGVHVPVLRCERENIVVRVHHGGWKKKGIKTGAPRRSPRIGPTSW